MTACPHPWETKLVDNNPFGPCSWPHARVHGSVLEQMRPSQFPHQMAIEASSSSEDPSNALGHGLTDAQMLKHVALKKENKLCF